MMQRFAALLLVAGIAAGCTWHAAGEKPERSVAPAPLEPYPVIAVRKIAIAKEHRGYLKVHEDVYDGAPVTPPLITYWIYDRYFKVLGFYTEEGSTYRFDDRRGREGDLVALGRRKPHIAIRILLGYEALDEKAEVLLLPMDKPRDPDEEAAAGSKPTPAPPPQGGPKPAEAAEPPSGDGGGSSS